MSGPVTIYRIPDSELSEDDRRRRAIAVLRLRIERDTDLLAALEAEEKEQCSA